MLVACPECGGCGVSGIVPEVCFYCEGVGVVDEEPNDMPDPGGDDDPDSPDEEQAEA